VRAGAAGARALDHVGVNRALGQPVQRAGARRRLLEDLQEHPPDDLPLLLRLGHAAEGFQEGLRRVDGDQVAQALLVAEDADDLPGLVEAQQTVVDEDRQQAVADGSPQQGSRYRRIHAAAEAQHDAIPADALLNGGDRFRDERLRLPARFAAADRQGEVAEHGRAAGGVGDFRVELHAVQAACLVADGGVR